MVNKWQDVIDLLRRYGKFSPSEIKNLIVCILGMAFIISFRDWGNGPSFDFAIGIINFIIATVIVTLSVLWHELGHRLAGVGTGFKVEFKLYSFGLITGIILAIVSRGYVWFLITNAILIFIIPTHRLGWIRYGPNIFGFGQISAWGPLFSIFFAIILKLVWTIIPSAILLKAVHFNILYAIWNILPIPPADGSRTYFGSRMVYVFEFSTIVVAGILLYVNLNPLLTIIVSLLVAAIIWVLYYVTLENRLWPRGALGGPG